MRSTPDPESADTSDTERASSSNAALVTGGVASMPTTAGLISPTLPVASTARTATVCSPSPATWTSPVEPGSVIQAPPSTATSRWSTWRSSVASTCTVAGSAYQLLASVPETDTSDTTGGTPSWVCIRRNVTDEAGNSYWKEFDRPLTCRSTGATLFGSALVLVADGDAASWRTVPVGSICASVTSTWVRTGWAALFTTLATMSPVARSRVTTWNSFSLAPAWS